MPANWRTCAPVAAISHARRRWLRQCAAVTGLALAGGAFAANGKRALSFAGSSFPYIFEELPGGGFGGVAVDLIHEIAPLIEVTPTIRLVPWKRAQAEFQSGLVDVLIGPYRTTERERWIHFGELPFYLDRISFYAKSDKNVPWHGDFAELASLRIGVTRGWAYGDAFDAARPTLQIEETDTLEQNFGKLALDRLDLVATNERNARTVIEKLQLANKVRPLQPPLQMIAGYFGYPYSPRQPELVAAFDRQVTQAVLTGRVQQISRRYGLDFPGRNARWPEILKP